METIVFVAVVGFAATTMIATPREKPPVPAEATQVAPVEKKDEPPPPEEDEEMSVRQIQNNQALDNIEEKLQAIKIRVQALEAKTEKRE